MAQAAQKNSFFSIIQHNCANSNQIFLSLFSTITKSKNPPKIVAIQEPWTRNNCPLNAPGYTLVYPPVTGTQKVTACIYISNSLLVHASFIPHFYGRGDLLSISIHTHKDPTSPLPKTIHITNAYNRHTSAATRSITPEALFTTFPGPTIVLGDLNIHHPAANPSRTISRNEMRLSEPYLSHAHDNQFTLLNTPDSITRFSPSNTHRHGVIDYTFANKEAAALVTEWNNNLPASGSDHTVIRTSLSVRREVEGDTQATETPDWKQTNWEPTLKALATTPILPPKDLDIDRWFKNALQSVMDPILENTPTRKISSWSKPWWTSDISEARKAFHAIAKDGKKNLVPPFRVKEARNHYFHLIRTAKQQHWKSFLANASSADVWRAKRLATKSNIEKFPSTPGATTPEEVNRALLINFFPPRPPNLPTLPTVHNAPPVTTEEVTAALKVSSNTSAPGPDKVQYGVWKTIHRSLPKIIPALLNPLLQHGYHPVQLKKAFGIVLPKPGKPSYASHSSFRIIVLLETISKILERIVATRLFEFAKSSGLLSPHQVGSVKGLSTADGISLLHHEVTLLQASGLKVSTLFLDIKGGFDNVDAKILAQTLRSRNTPNYMIQWISSFLSDRECTLIFKGSPRISLPVSVGTPQGSPISPLLFLIYVSPMHSDPHKGICISYVDDFAITVGAATYQRALAILAYEHKRMEAIGAARKVLFSPDKTELIHWRTPKDRSPMCQLPIHINGRTFNPQTELRWLGYWLTPPFNSTPHFIKRCQSASKTFAIVRRFSTAGKGFTPANARKLATMAILPILTYGASALPPSAQALGKMTTVWSKVIRWVTNCFRTSNIHVLTAELAFPAIGPYTRSLHLRHAIRCSLASPAYNPVAARMPETFPMLSPYRAQSHRQLLNSVARPSKPREWNDTNKNRRLPLPIDALAHLAHPTVRRKLNQRALREAIRYLLLSEWKQHDTLPDYYKFELQATPHLFMQMDKFIAGRIHQFRSHQSYLAGHPSWHHPNRLLTCPRCEGEDEDFEHAILHCPARDDERAQHLPKVNSINDFWQSEENLRSLGRYIRATKTGYPTEAFLEATPPASPTLSSSSELSSVESTTSHLSLLFPGWVVPTYT